ncbi:MAG: TonB family protein [Phenylobacterium sp.]
MIALSLALMAAEPQALPPKVVAPIVVTPMPKKSPPVDATVSMAGDVDSPRSQGVSIWPAGAYRDRRSGEVTLACWIDVAGLAEWCRVAFERPTGRGFGDAAMATRPHIRVTPRKGPDGAPVAGLMNIAMSFRAPDTQLQEGHPAGNSLSLQRGAMGAEQNPLPNTRITLMNNPVWAQAPTFEAVDRAYPAAGRGETGFVVAHCRVRDDGRLSSCRVATEEPRDGSFGAAALKLTTDFRVQPELMARAPKGEPVEVEVPIRLAPPGAAARTVNAPSWLQGFDPQAAPKLFPPDAAAKGRTSGHGVARCIVGADGGLTECGADGDDPEGFSEVAAKLAGVMRMNLWSADARPVQGATVRVSIRLDLQGGS